MRVTKLVWPGLLVLAACGSPAPRVAQTVGEGSAVLENAGMVGRWAQDCMRPYAATNVYLVYAAPSDGMPTEQVLLDPLRNRTAQLDEVKALPGGLVQWTVRAGDTRVTVVTRLEGGRLKVWSSTADDGTIFVKDGNFSGGSEAPWFNKCETN